MGIDCTILIHPPRDGRHKAGSVISGVVKYTIDKPTEFIHVTLALHGRAKAHWTENLCRNSYTGLQELISREINVTNKEPDQTVTLHGVYEHPFEFDLPENLPPSYKDTKGKITYMIKMNFEKPAFFSSDKVVTTDFTLYGLVQPTPVLVDATLDEGHMGPVVFGLQKKLYAPFTKKKPQVKLKAQIEKSCLTPGEVIHLSYVVTNNSDVTVLSVVADVYCYTIYSCGSYSKKKKLYVQGCSTKTVGVSKGKVGNLSCAIPTRAGMLSLQNCDVVSKEFRLRVTVHLPSPHNSAVVEVPIVLGEIKPVLDPGDRLDHLRRVLDDLTLPSSPPPYSSLYE